MALLLLHDAACSVQQQGVELPVIAAFLWGAGLQGAREGLVLVHCAMLLGRSVLLGRSGAAVATIWGCHAGWQAQPAYCISPISLAARRCTRYAWCVHRGDVSTDCVKSWNPVQKSCWGCIVGSLVHGTDDITSGAEVINCLHGMKQKRYSTGFASSIVGQVLRTAFGYVEGCPGTCHANIQFWVLTG